MLQFQIKKNIHIIANIFRQRGLLLEEEEEEEKKVMVVGSNQNSKCSLKRNWLISVLHLNFFLTVP
jgi:hypothetical protein